MDEHLEQLTQLCERLGSSPEQALIMARQLIKRADQLAAERGIKQTEAMDYLLRLMISGRQGNVLPEAMPDAGSSGVSKQKK
ncbi:MAG: hypothetical protein AAGA45_06100 [Verrucomicrobiota bacterium]